MHTRWTSAAFLLSTLTLSVAAHAHETWLAPSQRSVGAAPGALTFEMSSGERFPKLETAIEPDRIDAALCKQGAEQVALKPAGKGAHALNLTAPLNTSAAAICWVQLKPRHLDLALDKVEQYLTEIDAPDSARQAWQSMPGPRKWSEVYTKNAKVIVPKPGGSATPAATTPLGLKLEFVPGSDLSSGKLKGPLDVTVLLDGKPLAGLAVALWSEGKDDPVWRKSDERGRVSFTVPRPGRWLISGTDLRVVDARAGKWESQFSTLVFELLP